MSDPAKPAPAEAGDAIAAAIRAITSLVTAPPNLIGFDFADLRVALIEQGAPCSGRARPKGQTAPSGPPMQRLPTSGGRFTAKRKRP